MLCDRILFYLSLQFKPGQCTDRVFTIFGYFELKCYDTGSNIRNDRTASHEMKSFPIESKRSDNPVKGALAIVGASAFLTMSSATVKILSESIPSEMIVFFRSLFGLFFIFPIIFCGNGISVFKTSKPGLHLLRCCFGLGAMYCFFHTIAKMPLAEAVLLLYTNPLFVPLLAFFWLGEPVALRLRIAIVVGFVGVVFILRPGSDVFHPAALTGLASGILAAVAMVTIRRMSVTEPASRIVFYFALLSTIVSSIPLAWSWRCPDAKTWGLLILIGFLSTCVQLLLTKGYSLAPAARIGFFTYFTVLFSALAGWIFWAESLSLLSWAGAFLVIAAGVVSSGKK